MDAGPRPLDGVRGQALLVALLVALPVAFRAASSRWTISSCACSSSLARRGLHRPVITKTNGRKTIWPATHTHHQVCHWPGLSFCACTTLGPFSDRKFRSSAGTLPTAVSASPASLTLLPLADRKARSAGGTWATAVRSAAADWTFGPV